MRDIEDLHRKAMDLADQADAAKGDPALLRQAFQLERAAALLALERAAPQPSLGVLFRSAASLAFECGELADAKSLVDQALAWKDAMPGDLTAELAELRDHLASGLAATKSAP